MKIVKEFVIRDIAGECILIPIGETVNEFNGMITLTDSARFIWENLEASESLDDLISSILKEYNVQEEIARKETLNFLELLSRAGFIEPADPNKNW